MDKKNESNLLLQFLVGIAMLVVGGYMLFSSVTVTTSFFSGFHVGGMNMNGGLVVVPFIVGIIMLFFDFDSMAAKIVIGLGILLVIASIIMSTQFYMSRMNLYQYLMILIGIFGGLGLVLKVLFKPTTKKDK